MRVQKQLIQREPPRSQAPLLTPQKYTTDHPLSRVNHPRIRLPWTASGNTTSTGVTATNCTTSRMTRMKPRTLSPGIPKRRRACSSPSQPGTNRCRRCRDRRHRQDGRPGMRPSAPTRKLRSHASLVTRSTRKKNEPNQSPTDASSSAKTKPVAKAKTKSASYPWQNYTGPLQQNLFELRDGLKNSQYLFETTRKGTVAFVGGSITGMNWRKKVPVYFGLSGDPRTPIGVNVDGVYFDGVKGTGLEK